MTKFIPLFPLNIVVFPGEKLNLHIFEERYRQLIGDCLKEKKAFGIVPIFKNKMAEFGTSVDIVSIEKKHEEGNLDIRTEGISIFRVLEIIKEIPDKLYSGAVVSYPDNVTSCIHSRMKLILEETKRFHQLLEVNKNYKKEEAEMSSYDIGHYIGMSIEEEYYLLTLMSESERQEYVLRHLSKTIPTIVELQKLKERIQLNGHFRKLSVNEDEST